MQFDDNAIPSDEVFSNMKQAYSKSLNKGVLTLAEKQNFDPEVFDLLLEETTILKNLSMRSQNLSVRDYLKALSEAINEY